MLMLEVASNVMLKSGDESFEKKNDTAVVMDETISPAYRVSIENEFSVTDSDAELRHEPIVKSVAVKEFASFLALITNSLP